jgi:hypothetical protein
MVMRAPPSFGLREALLFGEAVGFNPTLAGQNGEAEEAALDHQCCVQEF